MSVGRPPRRQGRNEEEAAHEQRALRFGPGDTYIWWSRPSPATVRDGAGVAQVRPLVPELPEPSELMATMQWSVRTGLILRAGLVLQPHLAAVGGAGR
jgi:hypothetical protein